MRNGNTKAAMWVCVVHALFVSACADSSSLEPATDAGVATDTGGHTMGNDSSTPDVGLVPTSDGGGLGESTDIACADFRDDDHNGQTDCQDHGCGATHICCVGSTDAQCCVPPTTLVPMLALDTCTGSSVADCAPTTIPFGAPLPILATARADGGSCATGGAMAPEGSDHADGGLLSERSFDPSVSSIAIEARVGVSASPASSLDAIAIGLTTQDDLGTLSLPRVQPVVAVIVSATDQTIRAVTGDIPLPTHALGPILGAGCSELDVRIVTSPAGTFDAFYRATSSGSWTPLEMGRPFDRTPSAHAVTYGRSTSTDGVAHAWVRNVSVAEGLCDVLAPVRDARGAFDPLPLGATSITSVSRADAFAAYAMNGSIYAAGVDASGHFHTLGRQDADRILAPGEAPFMASGVADPELVIVEGNLRLFFTGIDASGTRSIGYLDYDATLANRIAGSTPRALFGPSEVSATQVDGPAYVETTASPDGTVQVRRWILFRAVTADGHSELRAAELVGSSAVLGIAPETRDIAAGAMQFFTPSHPMAATQALYVNRDGEPSASDRDEIASPEVVAYRGVLRVFYSARLGARWTIGMLRSPDFAHFERAYQTPVLSGSGTGFDAVSTSDPAAWLDSTGTLTLYYTGSDGTTMQPGLATQEVPLP